MEEKIKKEDFKPCMCCEVGHNKKLMIDGMCWRCKAHEQKTAKAIFDDFEKRGIGVNSGVHTQLKKKWVGEK